MAVRAAFIYLNGDHVRIHKNKPTIIIDGVTLHCSDNVSDLGHNMSTSDKVTFVGQLSRPASGECLIWSDLNLDIF